MKRFARTAGMLAVIGCFALALHTADAAAQFKGKNKQSGGNTASPAATADLLTAPLFPADTLAKLKLSDDQKKEYTDIAKDFDAQLKKIAGSSSSSTTNTTPPPKGKGNKGGKGGTATPATPAAQAISLRSEYEEKVEKLLTEAQKKTLDDIRAAKAAAASNPFNSGTSKK